MRLPGCADTRDQSRRPRHCELHLRRGDPALVAALDINNVAVHAFHVIGASADPVGFVPGFLDTTQIDYPGAFATDALGTNDSPQTAGSELAVRVDLW